MILTEQEAKTKMCCETGASGAVFGHLSERRCVASACMAWRWYGRQIDDSTFVTNGEHGYCGKAGKP